MNRTPMTVKKASEYSGFSSHYLYFLIKKNKIPYYKTGEGKNSKVIIAKEDLDNFLFAHRVSTEKELQEKSSEALCS